MRTIDELISYMDWTDDINYAELLQLKNVYLNNHNLDAFIEAHDKCGIQRLLPDTGLMQQTT